MNYLLAEEILAIHDRVIVATGGIKGVRDVGLLYSIAERPKMAMMGREFYPDIFTKASAYLEAIATYHVFADGNKRTAIAVTHYFLRDNGYLLQPSIEQAYRFMIAVAVKKKTMKHIATWLKKHAKRAV